MFSLGIVSFYLLKAREKLVLNHWDFDYVLVGMLLLPLLFFRDSPSMVPLMVWLPTLALLMAPETIDTRLVGMLRGALQSSPLVCTGTGLLREVPAPCSSPAIFAMGTSFLEFHYRTRGACVQLGRCWYTRGFGIVILGLNVD